MSEWTKEQWEQWRQDSAASEARRTRRMLVWNIVSVTVAIGCVCAFIYYSLIVPSRGPGGYAGYQQRQQQVEDLQQQRNQLETEIRRQRAIERAEREQRYIETGR